ncbi:hypothetical protein [Aurantimonas sp. VKM B-3413]|uniref:hypothetical protein n=1 Tax=Aurantimonas sp. VKM B-3413 TaxID=2779401 RepID=UPI001E55AAFD|nr:hypothetical protein [Aurantimonas sp. VKM B-3413]MCB8840065.1 hypothetical protein [Aurantimonas sp. VKM B-3413]
MGGRDAEAIVRTLLERTDKTFAGEMGLDLERNTPMPLFLWLVAANLFSARISADQALRAAKALKDAGLTTADHMAEATWKERVIILNRNGYARFDEKTSRFLQDMADHCLSDYGGDLRKLREAAGRDPAEERRLLKAFKGIGDTGADIFFREVQIAWEELYPFADARALEAAGKLGLGREAERLASLVDRKDYPRFLTALLRADLDGVLDEIASG